MARPVYSPGRGSIPVASPSNAETAMKQLQSSFTSIVGIALLIAASGCQSDRDPSLSVIPGNGKTKTESNLASKVPKEVRPDQPIKITSPKPIPLGPDLPREVEITESKPDPKQRQPDKPAITPDGPVSDQDLPNRIRFGDYWLDADALKSDTVYFAFDRSDIDIAELVKIEEVAVYLKTRTENAILVDGHCDDRGTEEYNRALGERRALTIRETLVSMGVPPDRIHTRSLGEDRPAEMGQNEFAWSRNRRGEFALLVPAGPDS